MVGGEQEGANKTAAPPTTSLPPSLPPDSLEPSEDLEPSEEEEEGETEQKEVMQVDHYVDGVVQHSGEIKAKRLFGASGDGAGTTETEPEAVAGVEGATLSQEDSAHDHGNGTGSTEAAVGVWRPTPYHRRTASCT
jgi:hypothetical protein